MKTLNIGLVGYGFMGRTHSNAFLQAPRFFDLPYRPVLKAIAARNAERAKAFAANWGYESIETDWRSPDRSARTSTSSTSPARTTRIRRSRLRRRKPARW